MSKYCPVCKTSYEDTDKFCSKCEDENGMPVRLVHEPSVPSGMGVSLSGDGNAYKINGGMNLHDSHNVSTVNTVTNNITNIAPQKSDIDILQEKKNFFLAECKRAYEDGILEPSEEVALEECRIKLGLDEATAKRILETVRLLADRNNRKTSLNPIAKTKLKILSDNLSSNNVPALREQLGNMEAIVNKYEHDELSRKYFLALAVLNPKKSIELKEGSATDSYWKSYWCYLAYIKENETNKAEALLAGLDRFADYPEDNLTILATAGALMAGNIDEAKEYLDAITGEFTTELQRFVDSVYLILDHDAAKEMGADPFACSFYLVNMFGQKDPKVVAAEEAERKAKEEAERKAKEEAERKAREEAERKAKEEAERKAKEEAERKAREEARRRAKEEAERRAKEAAERKAREENAECTIYIDSIGDMITAMMTTRSALGWSSAEFRTKTSSLPAAVSSVIGVKKAAELVQRLNNGGLSSHFKSSIEAEEATETSASDYTVCYSPSTKECTEAIDYAFGLNGKPFDVNKAIQLWKKAAEKEDPRALFDYGVCLGIGVGDVERQAEHSIECIHKALDKVLFAAKTGDRDGVLMAARCGLMGIIISTFNDLEPDGDMLIYANDFSEAAAEDGNIYARVIQYFLISNSIAIMDDEEVDVDILLKDIEDNISHSPIYADALMLLGGLCEEELNKEQVKRVIQLAQKAVKNHLYSNDLLTISMVASMVGDNNIDYKDDLVSYYVNLD
ncbi:MAG: hypothetical protein SPH70_03030 [Candidatus Cryptobacteroides sp.]|nr:hypothetical protein [Bacteroidales bacterium]MDY6158035.1 hypothetical protein [Candidatus Cryptobacteroides sp.]